MKKNTLATALEPKRGDKYWFFFFNNEPMPTVWCNDVTDYTRRKAGNFARTEAELLSRKDEIMREIGMIVTVEKVQE